MFVACLLDKFIRMSRMICISHYRLKLEREPGCVHTQHPSERGNRESHEMGSSLLDGVRLIQETSCISAGFPCDKGLTCRGVAKYPDASGTCVKTGVEGGLCGTLGLAGTSPISDYDNDALLGRCDRDSD